MTRAAATSDPRATETALQVLRDGGNAVDAAVAAALLLHVVEPQSCGVGGDAFILFSSGVGPPMALDGSGAIPARLTQEQLAADGLDAVPPRGARSATVPGAVSLFEEALQRFGTWSLSDAAGSAIAAASEGFEVRPTLGRAAATAANSIASDPVLGPLYVPDGMPIRTGQVVRNPGLAECLETLAADGAAALYAGDLAAGLLDVMSRHDGYLDADDLAAHRTEVVDAEAGSLLGHTVWELPLPTQGPAVLEALRQLDVEPGRSVDWTAVLDATREAMRKVGFDPGAIAVSPKPDGRGDTTYLAVIDDEGRTASLITSVFGDFGSHLGVPALGGPIHNRATTLRMVRQQPRPGKPPHTTIPALVTEDDRIVYALGVAGGLMQPQAQVQILLRMLVEGLDPQAAIDAPRFKICFGGDVALEEGHPLAAELPDALEREPGPEGFGGAQIAGFHDSRLMAGADTRRGGAATVEA